MSTDCIRFHSAALAEQPNPATGEVSIVLRGQIDLSTLGNLEVDRYQRKAFTLSELRKLIQAINQGDFIRDIDLGMRGGNFKEVSPGVFEVYDATFIIDGLQRTTSLAHCMAKYPEKTFYLGATLHFDTTFDLEKEMFEVLNTSQKKLSPNVLIANARDKSRSIATLYGLSNNDPGFAMFNKIQWDQKATTESLITALGAMKVMGYLHRHFASTSQVNWQALRDALDAAADKIGLNNMRENVKTFFELVDFCWGIRGVDHSANRSYLRIAFLCVLARVLADHKDFWETGLNSPKLFIPMDLKKKLRLFPINTDPTLISLAGASGKSQQYLYNLIVDHINSGKRTKHITLRRTFNDNIEVDADAA